MTDEILNPVTIMGVDANGKLHPINIAPTSNNKNAGLVGVAVIPSSIPQNRKIPSVLATHPGDGTSNVATWTVGEGIKRVTIPVGYRAVINQTNEDAKVALSDAGGAGTTVIYVETPDEPYTHYQKSVITQLDLEPLDGVNKTNVFILAGS